jgi:hypothetical protein
MKSLVPKDGSQAFTSPSWARSARRAGTGRRGPLRDRRAMGRILGNLSGSCGPCEVRTNLADRR